MSNLNLLRPDNSCDASRQEVEDAPQTCFETVKANRRLSTALLALLIVGACVTFSLIGHYTSRHRNRQSQSQSFVSSTSQGAQSSNQSPSIDPSLILSWHPSASPTTTLSLPTSLRPSLPSTRVPSIDPSPRPSPIPSTRPSDMPTVMPSASPTEIPALKVPSHANSDEPSLTYSLLPTQIPSRSPIATVSAAPSEVKSNAPWAPPSSAPITIMPTPMPTKRPTREPTHGPTLPPTSVFPQSPIINQSPVVATYVPGDLTVTQNGLTLSTGLTSRILARNGTRVVYNDGSRSHVDFHDLPDAGAAFEDSRDGNQGGWIYVSNSEHRDPGGNAGVGALTFDQNGNVINYQMVLTGTTANCGGGDTPWKSWISCEETNNGHCWEVDPTGSRTGRKITLGSDGGLFESFAYDRRNNHFFITEDDKDGPLRRFTPDNPDWSSPWDMLHGTGTTDYMIMNPSTKSFSWTSNESLAKSKVSSAYPNSEGIDVKGSQLFFVSKEVKLIFVLDLDAQTYSNYSTYGGLFDGQPDQLERIIGDSNSGIVYYTEDGGERAGIHGRNRQGKFFTILESVHRAGDETTGLAFSPDAKHLYFAYQDAGVLYDVTRTDGLAFDAQTLNVKYHSSNARRGR